MLVCIMRPMLRPSTPSEVPMIQYPYSPKRLTYNENIHIVGPPKRPERIRLLIDLLRALEILGNLGLKLRLPFLQLLQEFLGNL